MKKIKVLLCLLLLVVGLNLSVDVNAAELLPDDGGRITSAQIIQTVTGTGPWDANDNAGNDSSEENDVVRSFDQVTWTLENTLGLKTAAASYNGGRIYFEASLPEPLNSDTIEWNLDSMKWIEDLSVSSDKMKISGYYQLDVNAETIPGKQTLVFVANVKGAPNGVIFKPTFKTWLTGNSDADKVTTIGNNIRVSAAPNYNIKLKRNTDWNSERVEVNYGSGNTTGRMYGYSAVLQLYNQNVSKGLKGIEFPKGDITFDVNLKMEKSDLGSSARTDITNDTGIVLWSYNISRRSETGANGRRMKFNSSRSWFGGENSVPFGINRPDRKNSIYNSGNITVTQESSSKLKVTFNNYGFDGVFPKYNENYNAASSNIVYTENIGCFSVGYFQIFIPDNAATQEGNKNYYLTVSDSNFRATSISNATTTTQQNNGDDNEVVTHVRYKPGSYEQDMWAYTVGNAALYSHYDYADGTVTYNQNFMVHLGARLGLTNEDKIYSMDKIFKFDGAGVQPTKVNGSYYMISNALNPMKFKLWFLTKNDGTNWTSESERNSCEVEDLRKFENYEDIPAGWICIGEFYESTSGYFNPPSDFGTQYIGAYMRVTDNANIGETYGFTQSTKYWLSELDRNVYTQGKKNGYADYPTPVWQCERRNYIKAQYDANGKIISGTHSGGYQWGTTLLVVGATQRLSQRITDLNNVDKVNFDLGSNEKDARITLSPSLNDIDGIQSGIKNVTVTVTDTLPKGLDYVPDSSNYSNVSVTKNTDGTTTLVWVIPNCDVGVKIQDIVFDVVIADESKNGQEYENVAVISADDKIGNTKIDFRTSKKTIQIINLASHRLYKVVSTPIIEKNGEIVYSILYKNNTDNRIPNFQLLDILPYVGDGRGSDFNGTYKVTKLVLTQYDGEGNVINSNSNLSFKYTNDASVRNGVNVKDTNLGNGWTPITSENLQASMTAFCLLGEIREQGKVTIDVYMSTNGNNGGNLYANNATVQVYTETEEMRTSNVETQVVKRTIEGIAWLDANTNGIQDNNEEVLKNVEMTLTDAMGRQVTDVNGQAVGTVRTNESGYYQFTDLPRGSYYVKVAMPSTKYALTEKEVGNDSVINSKFRVDVKETDKITKLDSMDLPILTVSNVNAGFVKKPTKVIVNYLEDSTLTKLSDEITIDGRVDDNYSTENKLDEINANHGNKYEFVRIDGNATGTMIEDTLYITYYYQKKPAEIEVLYKEIGTETELATKETSTARVDDVYTTVNKLNDINSANGNKYEFVRIDGNATGTYTVEKQTITYWYQKKMAEIEVNYLEIGTNTVLSDQVKMSDRIDNPYTTENKLDEINANHGNKYEFVRVDGNANGNYTVNKQVITYYYQKKNTNVVILHVLEGTDVSNPANVTDVLYPTQNVTGRVDDTYTTQNKLAEINRNSSLKYEFVGSTNNTSGTMTVDTIYVIYTYNTIGAKVIVNHLEKDTNVVLNPQETKNGLVGENYETANKLNEINRANGNKYELVTPEPTNKNGIYTEEDIVVNYYYQKKMAEIEVNYLEVDSGVALNSQVTKQDRVDAPYTTENKLDEINVRYNNQYGFVRVDGNATGNYTVDKQVITYWYQKKAAEIEVQYREVGTEEELAEKVEKTSRVGDAYTTEDKLDEINANHGNKYEFVRIVGEEEGTYKLEKQTIIYYYQKKLADLEVNYLELETNKVLSEQILGQERVDTPYTTENKLDQINRVWENKYEFVRVDGNANGNYTVDKQVVTYYYQKKIAEIEVNYLEVGTNAVLSAQVTKQDRIDEAYTTENKLDEINENYEDKYEFVRVDGNETGIYTADKQVITYWYQKKPAEIEVLYKEIGTEKELATKVEKTAKVDDTYTTENKLNEINAANQDKYEFVRVDGNESGTYTLEKQTITYWYQKKMAEVEVNYLEVDTDKVLSDQVNMSDRIDNPYTTENKLDEINAEYGNKYEFVRVEGNPEGNYTLQKQVITYYYQKKMSEIEVNYLEVGTNAVLSEQIKKQDRIDNSYTTENKLDSINENYENKYEFVRVDGNENGTYTLGKQVITYWYQKKPAEIEVQYREVGTEEELADKVEKSARVDDTYTTENKLDEINVEHGNKYEFVRVEGNPEGTYTLEKQTIIYYYQKKMAEVEVNYLEVGTNAVLSEQLHMTDRIDNPYSTENKLNSINEDYENKYEFVRVDGNENGTYTLDKQVITYWYQKKPAEIEVQYREVGTEEELADKVEKSARVDDTYTTENKLDEINSEYGNKYEFVRVEGNPEGTYTLEKQTIIYYYQKKMAEVEVNYLEVGTNAVLSEQVHMTDRIDNPYVTENKLNEINAANGNKYEFVRVDGNVSGNYTLDKQIITYWYQKKETKVVILHVEQGTDTTDPSTVTSVLYPTETIEGRIDDGYRTNDRVNDINRNSQVQYEVVSKTDNWEGNMTLDTQYVIYVYRKIPAHIVVKHLDVNTKEELLDPETRNGYVGNEYTTENKLAEVNEKHENKYELVTPEPTNKNGVYSSQEQVIIYYYNKKPAQVNVKYVDIDTEEELVDGEEIVGKVDDEYTTEDKVKEINDSSKYKYVLVETTENTEGLMTVEDIEVVYYYKKVEAQVIVKYVDEKTGEEIAQREYIGGYVGDEYTSKSKEIDEYTLNEKKLPNNAEGEMTEEIIEVIYYYNKMIKIPETADINILMISSILLMSLSGITLAKKFSK